MKDEKWPRTGYIPTAGKRICFYADKYTFTLMDNDSEPFQAQELTPSEDGFLFGKTHDGYDIAIYVGKTNRFIFGSSNIIAGAYLVSDSNVYETNMSTFRELRFVGGTLNKLYSHESMKLDLTENGYSLTEIDNSRSLKFQINGSECTLTIGSTTSVGNGTHGVRINDKGIYLNIEFAEDQPLSTIFRHVAIIKELLAFMTFRQSVGFEKIIAVPAKEDAEHYVPRFQIFIRNDVPLTDKKNYNIEFEDLGDSVGNLLEMLYISTDKKPSHSLGFIPEDDQHSTIMTDGKVKEICSALECELTFIKDLASTEEEHLAKLIEKVKALVKEHKEGSEKLSEKTYDVINGSISNWSMSASDKFILLYKRYAGEMTILNQTKFNIDDDAIRNVVKYRNDVTHGRHRIMDMNVAITANILSGLVYCCILSRVGISREKILELCNERKLLL